ncbi:alpha/beta fold hydrolase [Alcaligenes faecalis]|uniref:alpha/beta fold hydrolase n=1 Tax=Alcaligenes faecalis TaxID=511 RepID=UPI0036638843
MSQSIYVQGGAGLLHARQYGAIRTAQVPLIVMHGVTGHAGLWHHVATALSQNRAVIALDMRGHGLSDWCAQQDYATPAHVQDLACLLEALGQPQYDLAGLSWGGLVSLQYAARYPERVRRLAVLDVEPSFTQSEHEVMARPANFPSRAAVMEYERKANPQAPQFLLQLFAYESVNQVDLNLWQRRHDPYFLRRWPFRNDDVWAQLEELRCPTLLLHGERSFVRLAIMQEMHDRLRHPAGLYELPDTGHLLPLEAPEPVAAYLEGFLTAD